MNTQLNSPSLGRLQRFKITHKSGVNWITWEASSALFLSTYLERRCRSSRKSTFNAHFMSRRCFLMGLGRVYPIFMLAYLAQLIVTQGRPSVLWALKWFCPLFMSSHAIQSKQHRKAVHQLLTGSSPTPKSQHTTWTKHFPMSGQKYVFWSTLFLEFWDWLWSTILIIINQQLHYENKTVL